MKKRAVITLIGLLLAAAPAVAQMGDSSRHGRHDARDGDAPDGDVGHG